MTSALCIDTKHGGNQATFGLDKCQRDHHGISGEQVKQSKTIYRLLNIFFAVGIRTWLATRYST